MQRTNDARMHLGLVESSARVDLHILTDYLWKGPNTAHSLPSLVHHGSK
jgi:hypothetical protein